MRTSRARVQIFYSRSCLYVCVVFDGARFAFTGGGKHLSFVPLCTDERASTHCACAQQSVNKLKTWGEFFRRNETTKRYTPSTIMYNCKCIVYTPTHTHTWHGRQTICMQIINAAITLTHTPPKNAVSIFLLCFSTKACSIYRSENAPCARLVECVPDMRHACAKLASPSDRFGWFLPIRFIALNVWNAQEEGAPTLDNKDT